jgi:type IV pilus assembly protein PilF
LAALPADNRADAETHANLGLQFAQRGDLNHAEQELQQAAKLAPADPEILTSLGAVLSMQNKLEESSGVFKQALRVSPHDVTARRYLAANLWQMQRYAEAKQNLQVLLQEKPGDEEARLLLGMVSENLEDYPTAARMLSSVPEQVRRKPESIAALARSYYHLGQKERARTTLSELSKSSPGAPSFFLGASIADEMGDYETAEKLLLTIPSTPSTAASIGYRLASVQYHAGRFDDSERTLLGLVDSGHADGQSYNLLGWVYYKTHRPQEAVQALSHAIDLASGGENNYLDLGQVLIADHSLPAALELARKAAAVFPNSSPVFELEGLVEAKMGQFADAIHSYSRAVELSPAHPDVLLGLAQAQFSAGKDKDAADTLDSGMKRFPKDARLKVLYASFLLKEGETADPQANRRAETILRSALVLDGSLSDAHYELGKLALNEGHLPDALEHLVKAAKLDPQSSSIHFALSRAYRRAGQKDKAAQEMNAYETLKREDTPAPGGLAPSLDPQSRF